MLGLKHTTVKLIPHSYKWQYLFQEECLNIRQALKRQQLRIEHVGSTALPDIAAKPILDMFIPSSDLTAVSSFVKPLARLGYEFVTDAADYKLFIKGREESRTHHLTFTEPTSDYWVETLLFRDYLLNNADVARSYEIEKLRLARQYPDSRRNYTMNKASFIQAVLKTARAELERTNSTNTYTWNTSEQSNTTQQKAITITQEHLNNVTDFSSQDFSQVDQREVATA